MLVIWGRRIIDSDAYMNLLCGGCFYLFHRYVDTGCIHYCLGKLQALSLLALPMWLGACWRNC